MNNYYKQRVPIYRINDNTYVDKSTSIMKLNGSGSIKVTPDIAIVILGVMTENKNLNAAQQENAVIAKKILVSLEKNGVLQKDIQTASYTIDPIYDNINGENILKAYRVTNRLRVSVRRINMVGQIIDDAVSNGANIVDNVSFSISQPTIYYEQALALAIDDAIQKAIVIEKKLDIVVNKTPVKIEEISNETLRGERVFGVPVLYTPIREGYITINAKIEAIFNYFLKNYR